jgi:hypothetical protein
VFVGPTSTDDLHGTFELTFEVRSSSAVPEPASLLIFGIATVLGLPLIRRFRKKKNEPLPL